MHWEAYSECSYVQLDPFARFSAAQGASSPRVRARQTSIATLRAREHARTSDMPSLSQAPCRSMRVRCDRGEPAPGPAYSDGGRTQTNGERSGADETGPGRGCTTALSSALGAGNVVCKLFECMRRMEAREHQWATATSTTEMQSAVRTAVSGEPPMCRQSTACDSGSRSQKLHSPHPVRC